jgi:hypothetical protein
LHTDLLFFRVPASFFAGFFAPAGPAKIFFSGRTAKKFFSYVRTVSRFHNSENARVRTLSRFLFGESARPRALAFSAQRNRESPYSLAVPPSGKRETSRCLHGKSARPLRSRVPFGKTANTRGFPSGKTRIGSFAGFLLLSRERSRVGPLQTANTLKIEFFGRTIRFFPVFSAEFGTDLSFRLRYDFQI